MEKSSALRILSAAQDMGSCNVLFPVVEAMRTRSVNWHFLTREPAHGAFEKRGIRHDFLKDDHASIPSIFDTFRPDLALIGSSYGPSVEDHVVEEARKRHIPSIGILDSWLNYEGRFAKGSDPWAYLPDKQIVMDDIAKTDMVALGAPENRLVVLGQPAFDETFDYPARFSADARRQLREKLGIGPTEKFILFFSQDMERFYGGHVSAHATMGYTEYEAIDLLIHDLETIAKKRGDVLRLVAKLHPRESPGKYDSRKVQTLSDADPYELALSADLVVGMDTILLVEAGLMGCVTLSLQPFHKGTDTLITNRLGLGRHSYDPKETEKILDALLFDPSARLAAAQSMKSFPAQRGATERIANYVMDAMISRNR